MAIRKIVKDSDPFLRNSSRPVEKIDARILTLLDDMHETLTKAEGAGLAAVQVGVLKRICLVDDGEEQLELINPEIIHTEGLQEDVEGCLSCPGKWGLTHRPAKVTVSCLNRNGERVKYTGEGIVARCFCHEIDHMSGKLFYDGAVRMFRDDDELNEYLEQQAEETEA